MAKYLTKKLPLVILLLAFVSTIVSAQTGKISGRITNQDGKPLAGANVVVKGSSIGAASNIRGEFVLTGVPSGSQVLTATYIGYQKKNINVEVEADEMINVNIELESKSIKGEEVEITAQAQGQMNAINQQVTSDNISNVVSSAKIQALPDANAAESIGRLPGVSIQRSSGEGSKVGVRGLSPKYNKITVNGITLPSSNLEDRSVDLNMVSSKMLGGIELVKSLTADMSSEAHGGTVNMQLKEAPEDLHYSIDLSGGYNDLGQDYDNYRMDATVSNRFFDNQIGVFAQFNIGQKQLPSDRFGANYSSPEFSAEDSVHQIWLNNVNLNRQNEERRRIGGSILLDYKSEDDDIQVKYFSVYNELNSDILRRENQYILTSTTTPYNQNIISDNDVTALQSHALQNTFQIGKSVLNVNLSYSESEKDKNGNEFPIADRKSVGSFRKSERLFAKPKGIIDNFEIEKPQQAYIQRFRNTGQDLKDANQMYEFSWETPYNITEAIQGNLEIGGSYDQKERSSAQNTNRASFTWGVGDSRKDALQKLIRTKDDAPMESINMQAKGRNLGVPAAQFEDKDFSYGEFLDGRYQLGWSADADKLVEVNNFFYKHFQAMKDTGGSNLYYPRAVENAEYTYEGLEEKMSGYIMTEINFGEKFRIIPGLRYEKQFTRYTGSKISKAASPVGVASTPIPDTSTRSNEIFFPSVNLRYKLSDEISVRGAVYKSSSRPSFTQISPTVIYGGGDQMISRNPFLEPATAWNYDLGLSFKGDRLGLITLNLYHKEIKDLIFDLQYKPLAIERVKAPQDVKDALLGKEYFRDNYIGKRNSTDLPINNPHKTTYQGLELSWQTNLWYLPGLWSGIVLEGNVSFIDSETKYPYFALEDSVSGFTKITIFNYQTRTGPMFDQPEAIYNLRLGYEYKGFSSRLSFRYQDRTVDAIDKQFGLKNRFTSDMFRIDLSLKQNITEHIQITGNLQNINEHIDYTYFNATRKGGEEVELPIDREHYGIRGEVGVSYEF